MWANVSAIKVNFHNFCVFFLCFNVKTALLWDVSHSNGPRPIWVWDPCFNQIYLSIKDAVKWALLAPRWFKRVSSSSAAVLSVCLQYSILSLSPVLLPGAHHLLEKHLVLILKWHWKYFSLKMILLKRSKKKISPDYRENFSSVSHRQSNLS